MSAGVNLWVRTGEPNRGNSSFHLNRAKVPTLSNTPIDQITFLQRTIGNREVEQLLRPRIVQAKLKVNKPGDVYEQEADRISDRVLATPLPAPISGASGIQRVVRSRSLKLLRPLPGWIRPSSAPANHSTRRYSVRWNSALAATFRASACIPAQLRNNRRGM